MSKKWFLFGLTLTLALSLVAGCSGLPLPVTGGQSTADPSVLATRIAAAAQGTATQIAVEGDLARILTQTAQAVEGPAATATEPQPLDTAVPTDTLEPTATPTETSTPTATLTPTATATSTPVPPTSTPTATFTPSATPVPCNSATFVKDVTVSDGSSFSPSTSFTKTWRLRNSGSCTWLTSYQVVYVSGDKMSGPDSVNLPANVVPGEEVDVSVNLTAPNEKGAYRGNWKLRDDKGNTFGVGNSSSNFYVDIVVEAVESKYPLDFAATYCSAEWTSGAGKLACPSPDNDSRGFVMRVMNPHLETGQVDDEPALLTNPQVITDGVIRGKYKAFKVENGQHFKAIVGCEYNAKKCDVKFELAYQIGDGSIQTLQTWIEAYEGNFTKVDVDLSSLAGKDVKFILTVWANGESNGDRALWLAPRIVKP